ncbi:MAG: GNAT family N-acetyltransferase, partial [Muribaculaceae bacterium]|nr:GNAT family N-acetyltransferase [Muribaculaceae bacterium]
MTPDEIKYQIMLLWKKTFHDTDEYINLVFDNYYCLDKIEYHEIEGKIVSALMEIPYKFGWKNHELTGMYLCGLMTDEKYRRQGIMQILLERAIEKAKKEGYAFCFLIPANYGLMKYYSFHGYSNAFYRIINRYTALHDFR